MIGEHAIPCTVTPCPVYPAAVLDDLGTPQAPVSWTRFKRAQAASNREPLPPEFSWLHVLAGAGVPPKNPGYSNWL